jgi:hypothetical protein
MDMSSRLAYCKVQGVNPGNGSADFPDIPNKHLPVHPWVRASDCDTDCISLQETQAKSGHVTKMGKQPQPVQLTCASLLAVAPWASQGTFFEAIMQVR